MSTTKHRARVAGFLYLLLALTAPLGLIYVPAKLMVSGDAAATAANLRASPGLLHLGIASELISQVVVIFVVLALYRLFRAVDKTLARQVVILGALVSVPIMFVNLLNEVAALILARGGAFLSAFERPQLDALAYLFLHLHGEGVTVASVFWGLWLFPFGLLVIRSRFIPRLLGVLLIVAGVGYVASAFTALVLPVHAPLVSRLAELLVLGEVPIIFWLLIWGARGEGLEQPPSSTG